VIALESVARRVERHLWACGNRDGDTSALRAAAVVVEAIKVMPSGRSAA
jgi:hypothetical protein